MWKDGFKVWSDEWLVDFAKKKGLNIVFVKLQSRNDENLKS